MPLNEAKGNMYAWATHTWNPVKGKCSHDCSYCYMKRWGEQKPLRLVEKEFKTNLGSDKTIFVCSGTDLFAWDVPDEWIIKVLKHTCEYQDNKYLFQTKNPIRFLSFKPLYPSYTIFATTIESNRIINPNIPSPRDRADSMAMVKKQLGGIYKKTMVTIEPVLDFDSGPMYELLTCSFPDFINIGADSGGHNLPEPNKAKLMQLISSLSSSNDVHVKSNLGRLLK